MTLGIYIIGALVAFSLLKFLIKVPVYLITFAFLGALGYAVYVYIWPRLQQIMETMD